MIFGENLIVLMLMALGGALAFGTAMALVRPNQHPGDDQLERPPLGRSLVMIAIGAAVALWALLSLLT